jgi:AraC family transcriptional regulator
MLYTLAEVNDLETINYLNNAIEYIEDNLDSAIKIDEIAKVEFTSRYHFQRLFHAFTGFTLSEYIRNRRLTLAGEELHSKDAKIIDVALKYGYVSADAFTKAFQRLHGVTPSKIKKGNVKLKAFPKISLQISITGKFDMNYRIIEKNEYEVFGVVSLTAIKENALYHEIPVFCKKIWEDGTHLKINELLGFPKTHMLHGIHYDMKEDGSRRYMMGWEVLGIDIPKEYKILDIPACTWAVFEGKGIISHNQEIQHVWKRIYCEWFPSSGFEQVEGPCVEKYHWEDELYEKFTCEVWIPVRRKEQS